jgi:hypothetical protein
MEEQIELPALPNPTARINTIAGEVRYYTADQMQAYARQAVLAEREKWHTLMRYICNLSDSGMADGDTARELAAKALGLDDWQSAIRDSAG